VWLQLLLGQLVAQLQALRDAEAVLLVDHRQPELRKMHVALDHRMRADDQLGVAGRDALDHRGARLALAAAGEPRDADAQRLQPLQQLAEMLLGEDLGRRHQRALPAGVDRHRRRERGHHRLAGADIALQQAVHRLRAAQVGGDLVADAVLRAGERERQRGEQLFVQAARLCFQRRRAQAGAFTLRGELRELLGEQFLELDALPGGVRALFQRGQTGGRGWMVQKVQRLAQTR